MIWAAWWAWALAAVALGVLELLTAGQIALGFAIGAGAIALGLLTGVLGSAIPLAGGYGLAVLLVLFAALSWLAWWGLRAAFGPPGDAQTFDHDVND